MKSIGFVFVAATIAMFAFGKSQVSAQTVAQCIAECKKVTVGVPQCIQQCKSKAK